ncbi:hypothetical protein GIB67_038790 [Kingdonia uniflora]|uniref:THIF-type NAD/FAD binding fold domain-containing protein n=1 Tax=Kingdonia uniflora TaxID=39325 RepID=A0A7J7M0P2_9MAGN|nr:hypothetical protein GIB67_038790 [Kingdonia uniflora]
MSQPEHVRVEGISYFGLSNNIYVNVHGPIIINPLVFYTVKTSSEPSPPPSTESSMSMNFDINDIGNLEEPPPLDGGGIGETVPPASVVATAATWVQTLGRCFIRNMLQPLFCKNIVLAGVGSLTLMDDRAVTEEAISANFLVPLDEINYNGRSLAEVCCDALKEFNPMVRVSVLKGDLSSFDGDFYDKFSAVVISCCSITTKKLINDKCRKRAKPVAFYTVDCRDLCGEIFVDLQNYTYGQKRLDETIECQLKYPSFEEAISLPWKALSKKVSMLYFAMRVIERFELVKGRTPGEISIADLPSLLKLKKELCETQSLNESHIPDSLLERLILGGTQEHPPVCAIIGGILGQEVIKVTSGKGDPIKNFFFYDVMDGKGIIEDISVPDTGN